MCGLYGMVSFRGVLSRPEALEPMGQSLRHRGPDDRLLVVEPNVALGTERLRITDTRPEGAQPFTDPSSRVWLSCNGAIYNAEELRINYATYPYCSRSDVETLLPAYLDQGAQCFDAIDGMFAVAVWDGRTQRLTLARDRSGEKPLFYLELDDEIWFASEVQALLYHPTLERTLDRIALADYTQLGYVREPRTMFSAIRKVEAGTVVSFEASGREVRRYWHPGEVEVAERSPEEAERELEQLLVRAVGKQLQADVPVGVFTSGGVDSALLATLAADATDGQALHTFTVGFQDSSYDERLFATRVAELVGSRHFDVKVDQPALQEAFETVSNRVAEPIADPALLPTCILATTAKQHVGVVMSGEGADELFGGYPTYLGHAFAPTFMRLPSPVRQALAAAIDMIPPSQGKVPLEFLLKRFVEHAEHDVSSRHVAWFGTGLPATIVVDTPHDVSGDHDSPIDDQLRRVMLFDYRTYLPDDLLAKVDRATMLASLEARSPYLDRNVVQFALSTSTDLKVRGLSTKWLLKRVAQRRLPRSIVRRRKRGLSVPVGRWINEGLRAEADRLLAAERIAEGGLLDPVLVRQLLSEHRSGRANHARGLWALLVFERWREQWAAH
jgi:asparagine synthase (glutamine-hydrolysing)